MPFNKGRVLHIVGTIEDRIAAYYQNISIAQINDATHYGGANHKRERSEIESDKTS